MGFGAFISKTNYRKLSFRTNFCKRFGIDLGRRTKHGALLDSELLADVYIEMLGGNQISMFEIGLENNPSSAKEKEDDDG